MVAPKRTGQKQKIFQFSEAIGSHLEKRKNATDVPVSAQIRRAIEYYVNQEHHFSHRLLTTEQEIRKPTTLSDELFGQLRARAKESRLGLNESVQVAVALYLLREEGRVPGIEPEILRDIAERLPPEPKPIALDAATQQKLAALGVSLGMPPEASEAEIIPRLIRISDEFTDGVELLKLPRQPCGPWKEAVEEAEAFKLPAFFAAMIGARDGDWLVPTGGQSMREAGIPDDGAVVMRPLDGAPPDPGTIVLACAKRASGQYFYTVKFWYLTPAGAPELRDGKLRVYHLPPDVKNEDLEAVAALIGVIGRATLGGTIKGRRAKEKRDD